MHVSLSLQAIANVCINEKVVEEVGMFNERMNIFVDFNLWVRLAKDYETRFIPQKLVEFRNHDRQLSRWAG